MERGSSTFSFATQKKVALDAGSVKAPFSREKSFPAPTPPQKIACGAQCGYSSLYGMARRGYPNVHEARPLTRVRVVRPPPSQTDPACGTQPFFAVRTRSTLKSPVAEIA